MIAGDAESCGLVIAGEVVSGTDWIRRSARGWWSPGERGTKTRAEKVDLFVGHWTGGEAGGVRMAHDHGPEVVRRMKLRRSKETGELMRGGIQFGVGGPGEDWEADVDTWQTADPGLTACGHVSRMWDPRAIGAEVVSAGLPGELDTRHRPQRKQPFLGRIAPVCTFSPGQLRAFVRLAETLAALDGRAGISIPRRVPYTMAMRRLTKREARAATGGVEHLLSPSTKKLDAAGMLIDALIDAGWAIG